MPKEPEKFSMQDAMRLANSPAGKALIELLNSDPKTMEQAKKQADMGNYDQVKQTLSKVMQSPKVQQLLQEMERQNG